MTSFARAHDRYLEPPDDDPICEDGCGAVLHRDRLTGEWVCVNKFCPTKFQGVEQEMANALVDALHDVGVWKARYERMKEKYDQYVKDVEGKE